MSRTDNSAALWAFVRQLMQRTAGDNPDLGADSLGPAPTITLIDGVWRVDYGDRAEDYETRDEAFAAIEASDWFAEAVGRKHPDKWPSLVEGRWVDAASVEDLPSALDGSQIREEYIDQMVDNLARERTARPVDGGGVSESHSSVSDDTSSAAGRVFAGVRVIGDDEKKHIWLYVRLLPEVDEKVDTQQLAFGSIAFVGNQAARYGDPEAEPESIGAWLHSYALTNQPFVDGLEPHQPRAARTSSTTAGPRLAFTRSRKIDMTAKKNAPASKVTPEEILERAVSIVTVCERSKRFTPAATKLRAATAAERGPAGDKLAAVAASLGLTAEQAKDYYEVYRALCALETVATAEAAIEGGSAPAEGGERTEGTPVEDGSIPAGEGTGERALEGEAAMTWMSDAVAVLGAIFGGSDEATLLDKLKASQDLFAGALASAASGDENTGEGGQSSEGERAARAEVVGLRTEIGGMRKELDALRADKRARDIRDTIARRFAEAQCASPAGEDLDELVALCEASGDAWEKLVERSVRAVNRPPAGTVIGSPPASRTSGASAPTTQAEALEVVRARLVDEGMNARDARFQATRIAPREFPALFAPTTETAA